MITLEQARENQRDLQAAADDLLSEYGILNMLSKYGDVKTVGSYEYGLMVYPDIDFTVINPEINSDQALELGRELLSTEGISNFQLNDFISSLREQYTKDGEGPPYGFCFQTKVYHEKSREDLGVWLWKLDIWLMPEEPSEVNRTPGLESADWFEGRTEEEKDAMLLLKSQLWEMGIYAKKGVASHHVYRAAIEGVRSIDDFMDWIKETYGWSPV